MNKKSKLSLFLLILSMIPTSRLNVGAMVTDENTGGSVSIENETESDEEVALNDGEGESLDETINDGMSNTKKKKRSNDFAQEGDEDYNGYDEWAEVGGGVDKRTDLTRKLKKEKKNQNIFLKVFDKTIGRIPLAKNLPNKAKYAIEGVLAAILATVGVCAGRKLSNKSGPSIQDQVDDCEYLISKKVTWGVSDPDSNSPVEIIASMDHYPQMISEKLIGGSVNLANVHRNYYILAISVDQRNNANGEVKVGVFGDTDVGGDRSSLVTTLKGTITSKNSKTQKALHELVMKVAPTETEKNNRVIACVIPKNAKDASKFACIELPEYPYDLKNEDGTPNPQWNIYVGRLDWENEFKEQKLCSNEGVKKDLYNILIENCFEKEEKQKKNNDAPVTNINPRNNNNSEANNTPEELSNILSTFGEIKGKKVFFLKYLGETNVDNNTDNNICKFTLWVHNSNGKWSEKTFEVQRSYYVSGCIHNNDKYNVGQMLSTLPNLNSDNFVALCDKNLYQGDNQILYKRDGAPLNRMWGILLNHFANNS